MGAKSGYKRIFFALWPDEWLQQVLTAFIKDSLQVARQAMPIKPENIHITLAFLGNVDQSSQACYEQAAARLRTNPFRLDLDRLNYRARQQLLWLEQSNPTQSMSGFVDQLHKELSICGFQTDNRPFITHCTLARKVKGKIVSKLIQPIQWPVKEFCLVESQTLQSGASYGRIKTWKLTKIAKS